MRPPRLVLVLALLLAVPIPGAGAAPPTPPGFSVTASRPVHAGVDYLTLTRTGSSPAVAHVAYLAAGAPVELRAVNANDRITHDGDNRELVTSMCARVSCLVGVNGDFWDYDGNKEPLGGVVTGGRMLRSPVAHHAQVTLTSGGGLHAGVFDWSARLTEAGGTTVAVDTINRTGGAVVLFTPEWGPATGQSAGVELVLSATEPLAPLNRAVAVDAVALRQPGGDIPAGGAVLVGTGAGEAALRQLWDRVAGGDRRLQLAVSSPFQAQESLGTYPVLLQGGQKVVPAGSDGFISGRLHRTVLGWNAAGDVFMVAVDDRTDTSRGMSLDDAADFLLGLGATEAVNFDGGGGTTLVVDGSMVNATRTDDGDIERPAVSAWVAVPRTASPPPSGGGPTADTGSGSGAGPSGPTAGVPARSGYWMVAADGAVYSFGDAPHLGNAPLSPGVAAVDLEPTPSGGGYWIIDDAGHVFSFGDAGWHGNAERSRLAVGERVTSLSATPSGAGYWIFTSRGRVLTRGDAVHFGDMAAVALNGPVLDSIPTPSGLGYYMVASDGGIFAFGDARFAGSMGGIPLNAPVQSLVPDPDGTGYWLVASDGGIFAFDAAFRGSMGGRPLNRPVTGMVPNGSGYLMVAADGGIFNFSDRAFLGSLGANPPAHPVIAVAAMR